MSAAVIVTTLVENTVNIGGLGAEHGLSFLIRAHGRKLLFDTGQTDLLLQNTRKMGLTLDDVNAVVLSHGHYDHSGGVDAVCQNTPGTRLFAHPAAMEPKYTQNQDGLTRFIGLTPGTLEWFKKPGKTVWTNRPTEVLPGFFVTGEIPRTNAFEDTGGRFFSDASATHPDPLLDDQALFFDTEQGLVVILGCAHAGVVNTLTYIRELTNGRPLHSIIGGMHLLGAGVARVQATLDALRRWTPRHIVPAHCTGAGPTAQLLCTFPGCATTCPTGTSLVFQN